MLWGKLIKPTLDKYRVFADRLWFRVNRRIICETALAYYAVQSADQLIPLVATTVACFQEADDFEAHAGPDNVLDDQRLYRYTPEQWRKTSMRWRNFSGFAGWVANTIQIAKRCGVELTLGSHFLPEYPVPTG